MHSYWFLHSVDDGKDDDVTYHINKHFMSEKGQQRNLWLFWKQQGMWSLESDNFVEGNFNRRMEADTRFRQANRQVNKGARVRK